MNLSRITVNAPAENVRELLDGLRRLPDGVYSESSEVRDIIFNAGMEFDGQNVHSVTLAPTNLNKDARLAVRVPDKARGVQVVDDYVFFELNRTSYRLYRK
jgi:hypothetical protein